MFDEVQNFRVIRYLQTAKESLQVAYFAVNSSDHSQIRDAIAPLLADILSLVNGISRVVLHENPEDYVLRAIRPGT